MSHLEKIAKYVMIKENIYKIKVSEYYWLLKEAKEFVGSEEDVDKLQKIHPSNWGEKGVLLVDVFWLFEKVGEKLKFENEMLKQKIT